MAPSSLEPRPPRRLEEPESLLTPAGRLEWWREHRSHYRQVGVVKINLETVEYRHFVPSYLPIGTHTVYVAEQIE